MDHPGISTYGFLPISELQDLFNTHSLFLMPALNEPWGLVFIEAMLCKMPVVGLNRNSFPEISNYGEFGYGLDEADPKKLGDVIVNAFNNVDELERKGSQAQLYCVEQYTWERSVDIIISTIEKLQK